MGTYLTGSNSISPLNRTTSANIAMIVVPGNLFESRLFIEIQVGDPQGNLIGTLKECDFFFKGNDTVIANGDNTPSILDDTDFGSVAPGSVQHRTYTIHNHGTGPLRLGLPSFTGDSKFSLVGEFPSVIHETDSATFTIGVDTSLAEEFNSMISFMHNDYNSEEGPFQFSLSALVIPEPSTAILMGLAMVGLIGLVRHGRAR